MREWYTSNELLGLDGIPSSLTTIAQKARRNNWLKRKASGQGRAFEYHISNFHPDVKRQLIKKYVTDSKEATALLLLDAPSDSLYSDYDDPFEGIENVDELSNEEFLNIIVQAQPTRADIEAELEERKAIREAREREEGLNQKTNEKCGTENAQSNVSKVVPLTEVKEWCELPVFDVHAAAGAGSLVHSEYQIEQLIIPTSLLAEFGLSPANASIIYVDGNSMEPTLSHKDRLLVDTRELQHPVTDGVYVIRIDDAVYVKRLKWNIPKGIYNVVSDNPEHESFEINHNNGRNFKIIGKAVAPVFKRIF